MPSLVGFVATPIRTSNNRQSSKTRHISPTNMLICKTIDGMLAGLVGVSFTYPLDLSKTRLQNQAAFKLVANDLIRKELTDKETGHITMLNECLTGAFTGLLQSVSITPRELLKIKGQEAFTRGEKFSLGKSVREIYTKSGVKGFYRGWAATVARDVPYAVVYFPLYAHLKNSDMFHNGKEFKYNFLAGFISGMAAAGVSCPFDVIKTRLQNQPAGVEKLTWMGCARKAWTTEGQYRAFFKGVVPRMMCIGSLFATAQAFYELQFGIYIFDKVS